MAVFFKAAWAIRAIFYKIFFAEFGFPGYIGRPIFLMGTRKMHVGSKVRIFPGMRAEVHGSGSLHLDDNISIGQNFHVIAGNDLRIGSGCLISGDVFITDIDHSYENPDKPVFDQPDAVKKTWIGDNCFLGIGVRIQAGTSLGNGCIVGANSVVRGTFPDHSVIAGIPARIIKRYNPDCGTWERV